jgi:hypothetical protein
LRSGRIDEVQRDAPVDDPLNKILVAAAVGDYRHADDYLAELQRTNEKMRTHRVLNFLRTQLTPNGVDPGALRGLNEFGAAYQSWADLAALRGVLALEAGDTAAAGEQFGQALRLAAPSPSGAAPPAFQFSYLPMAAWYQGRLEEQNGGKPAAAQR